MNSVILVGLGGALGSIARFKISAVALELAAGGRFPLGTFLVNVIGCLTIGVLAGLAAKDNFFSPDARLFFFTGITGGFTTFSAVSVQVRELLATSAATALAYAVGSVLCCVPAVALGSALAHRIAGATSAPSMSVLDES